MVNTEISTGLRIFSIFGQTKIPFGKIWLLGILITFTLCTLVLNLVRSESQSQLECECMDYWQCAIRSGQIFSYCGISETEVCCFQNAPSNSTKKTVEQFKEEIFDSTPTTRETTPQPRTTTYSTGAIFDLDTTTRTHLSDDVPCGLPSVPVVLDFQAQFREWPWHVAILEATEDLYICGGSLLSPNKVITGAHCVSSYTRRNLINSNLKVRAGEYDISGNLELDPHKEILVDTIIVHPDFNNATLDNDIAILGLESGFNYTLNIRPLCLPPRRRRMSRRNRRKFIHSKQTKCVVTGWGKSSEGHSIILKEVLSSIWEHGECEKRLRRNFGSGYNLPRTVVCAGDNSTFGANSNGTATPTVCDGDGGSPLVCQLEDQDDPNSGRWYQEGIVSFGVGCERNSPGVYTLVSSYLGWIREYVN